MSFKSTAGRFLDAAYVGWTSAKGGQASERLHLTYVLHVEQLFDDSRYQELLVFLEEYRRTTGVRAVATCITPLAPILGQVLAEKNFPHEKYWDRIREVGKNSIVGLHGHFLRADGTRGPKPIHNSFFDMELVESQIREELSGLRQRELVRDDLLVYAGGWWFSNRKLRRLLVGLGFRWDYSISPTRHNQVAADKAMGVDNVTGLVVTEYEGKKLYSAPALASFSRTDRPYHAISYIMANRRGVGAGPRAVSLYSHDYDLYRLGALASVRKWASLGIQFSEPTPALQDTFCQPST